ncbi:MAG: hypothetical protein OEQ14_17455 [Gammaproteobacteria bacterium]|nr:hypothetical protein [Gammaproteobacteria bacterium]
MAAKSRTIAVVVIYGLALLVSGIAVFLSGDKKFGLVSVLALIVLMIFIVADRRGVRRSAA